MSTVHSLQIIFVEKLLEGNALGPMGLSAGQKVDHENRPHETWEVRRQRSLKLRAHLMQEAIRNHDFTFRLPIDGLLPGERAMQQTLNKLGETIRQQVNLNEVESWERLTRVLTHEMMNATAPITSISQSMLGRDDVKGSPLEPGIQAIYDTSRHLNDFVVNYRKMSELEKPVLACLSVGG